ncbi:MAG: PQQ-dependent sugar dehydrogenase [Xanthobacteraceae bacterium]
MFNVLSCPRALLLAGAVSIVALPAFAQQQPAVNPGSPLFGQPNSEGATKLAPVPGPPLAVAADKLRVDKIKLPKGFKLEVYAAGVTGARSMRLGDKGTLFVGTWQRNKLYAITDKNGKGEVKTLAEGLDWPNGLAFKDGTLYVAEQSKISAYPNIEDNLDKLPTPKLVYDDLPKDKPHGWKFIGIGPDNKLYVPVGQPGNNVERTDKHAQIRRMNLDGTGVEVIARGVRNTVGFDWSPVDKSLYFSDNGRDWLSENVPQDELNRLTKVGQDFGSPYCYQGDFLDPEFGWGHSCDEFVKPVALTGPHAAGLGLRFYTGSSFPAEYKNQIFLARHGSWNRTQKFGADIAIIKLNKDGSVKSVEPFLSGFIENNTYLGRPVDVLVMKDGSLLFSDDWNGAIWRISYGDVTASVKR